MRLVRVTVLGQVEAGAPVLRPVAGARLQALLVRLALDAGRVVSAGALVDAVWPDAPPADGPNALQSLVSRLRRTLDRAGAVQQAGGGYRLVVEPDEVDALELERLARQGRERLRSGDPAEALRLLRAAEALWRGPLTDAVPEPDAARLEQVRADLTADRIEAQLVLGLAADTLPELDQAVRDRPRDERATGQLMQALAASGRTADALAVYQRLREGLADELGADPSPALQAAHLELLRAPAPTPSHPVSNLRSAMTRFVGREREVRQVAESLRTQRLSTVLGPGGAGKTRLALRAAQAEQQHFEGVWVVELAPILDPAEVAPASLSTLGRREVMALDAGAEPGRRASGDVLDVLVDTLAERPTLLVLDNCEHLLDAVAQLVDTLLARCPRLTVLTTSREPIGLLGEALVPLAPLGLPAPDAAPTAALASPAVELFVDRATAARPEFRLEDSTVGAVVEIVRRLDGLPLAIELAAAKLRSMAVADVASRLSDRFHLLTGGSRTALPRHRTLHAVVDWSWELLDERERLLTERLAVFPGGVSVEAATAVCSDERIPAAAVPDLLTSIVDKSLLSLVEGTHPTRYRMLETIREFGTDRLADRGELARARSRHALHFAELAHRADAHLRGREQLTWLRVLNDERDNLLAALRHLIDDGDTRTSTALVNDLTWYWTSMMGRHGEAAGWAGAVLRMPGHEDDLDHLVLRAVEAMSRFMEHGDQAGRDVGPALAELGELADEVDRRITLEDRQVVCIFPPMMYFLAGRPGRSAEALDRLVGVEDPWLRAVAHAVRARLSENNGDLDGAREDCDRAAVLFDEVGDEWQRVSMISLVSTILTYDGDLAGAEEILIEARSTADRFGSVDVNDRLFVLLRLIDVRIRRGDLDGAAEVAQQAHELTAQGAAREMTAMARAVMAGVARARGDASGALVWVEQAQELLADARSTIFGAGHGIALVCGLHALLLAESGEPSGAAQLLRKAYDAGVATQDMPLLATVGMTAAGVRAVDGDWPAVARTIGAADAVRGVVDAGNPEVARLRAAGRAAIGDRFDELLAVGRALSPADATSAIAP